MLNELHIYLVGDYSALDGGFGWIGNLDLHLLIVKHSNHISTVSHSV